MRVAVEADTPKATVLISGFTTDIASRMETTEYAEPPAANAKFSRLASDEYYGAQAEGWHEEILV